MESVFGPVAASYTRAQAIEDGILVDVGSMARGPVSRPVALTHAAWCDCVAWTEQNNRFQVHHDESGRLWDVLFMAFYAIRTSKDSGDRL